MRRARIQVYCYIFLMLHGINRISVEEYGMICKALGVPVEFFYLYNGDEKKEEGLKQ